MKRLHRPDFYAWSAFDEARDIDFHSVLWTAAAGNLVVDPLPLSEHDARHLRELGGVSLVVVTNSDHTRAAAELAAAFDARLAGPHAEREGFPLACQLWLSDGDEPLAGVKVLELHGSKTPGELALLVGDHTLITGDLVRGHVGGALNLLPESKLSDVTAARSSLSRLAALAQLDAVLVGDGWPVFRGGRTALAELEQSLGS